MHRLGLIALIDALDVAVAHDATDDQDADADVLVAVVAAGDTSPPSSLTGSGWGGDAEPHAAPVIVATAEAANGRQLLRHLTGSVRGVVTLAAPPATWACAITGVVAGGYVVDPVLTRELVLLAAVGTPYGPRPLGLTAQQQRILDLVATGMSNRAIAGELGISPDTVKTHLSAAMRLLDAATASKPPIDWRRCVGGGVTSHPDSASGYRPSMNVDSYVHDPDSISDGGFQ